MARQLRIEYPGAFYHITSRGNQKERVFLSDYDRTVLLDYLRDANKKYGAIIHTYCLMDNHYHLLLETPHANLSKTMHFINTSYTIFFNTKHARVGHLFRGRFKAILIETDSYAQELSRYIHLNPVRAGIVARPEEYIWSSYLTFISERRPAPWLNTAMVLGYFDQDLRIARTRYAIFVTEAIGKDVDNPLKKADPSLILGSNHFVAQIKAAFLSDKTENRDVPAIRSLKEKPPIETIQRAVEQTLGAKNRFARNAAIFLCHTRTDYALKEISEFYSIGKSAIASVCRQMTENLTWNKILKSTIDEIAKSLFK
jgi:REP element-mobilizing transposase RayT